MIHALNTNTYSPVALRVRAWIEIELSAAFNLFLTVALRVRAWIEMVLRFNAKQKRAVALRVRAWIEIAALISMLPKNARRSPCESVD